MSDELESLTYDELDEIFAVEICRTLVPAELRDGAPRAYSDVRTGAYRDSRWRDCFTDFTRDANAVIPWLLKEREDHNSMVVCGPYYSAAAKAVIWSVEIIDNSVNKHVVALCTSFPCAAVLALIRAKRTFRP